MPQFFSNEAAGGVIGGTIHLPRIFCFYEKEFATDESRAVPEPWVSGHPYHLLHERAAPAAITGIFGKSIRLSVQAHHLGNAARIWSLVSCEHLHPSDHGAHPLP